MNESEFLAAVNAAFRRFLETGTSRSPEKLRPLHGVIAADFAGRLGGAFRVHALGYGDEREIALPGRYMEKKTDIAIERGGRAVAGVAVKFVMQNYSQNSNNYFENMLGETANLRAGAIPYFQVFVIPDRIPYYRRDGTIARWEELTVRNVEKYLKMDADNPSLFFHTPDKMLFYPVHLPDPPPGLADKEAYLAYYRSAMDRRPLQRAEIPALAPSNVLVLDWEIFAEKACHRILAL